VALSARVARSDGARDTGPSDLGFHYDQPGPLTSLAKPIATIYVRAAAGDDVNDGSTPATALRTIARAATQAGAGTTVVIGPGIYREGNLHPLGDGDTTHPIVFSGDPTGALTGDAPGAVLVDAGGASTGFRLSGRSYVRLNDIDVTGAGFAGIVAQNTAGVEVVNCRVFSNAGHGIMVVRPRAANTLFNNLVYANGGDGVQIRMQGIGDNVLRLINTTVYGNSGRGVWISRSGSQRRIGAVLVANNVVQHHGNSGDLVVTPRGWATLRFLPNLLSQRAIGVSGVPTLSVAPSVFGSPAGRRRFSRRRQQPGCRGR